MADRFLAVIGSLILCRDGNCFLGAGMIPTITA